MSLKNGKNKICTICSKKYYVVASRAERSKHCSRECWNKRRVLKTCQHCKNKITSYYGKKYCSRECAFKAMVGPKAARWKDGKSLERDRLRLQPEVRKWRKKVFERDRYTCQHCEEKQNLQAHHIIEWAKDKTQRFNIDNGITLCVDCHGKVHDRCFKKKLQKFCKHCGVKVSRASDICRSCSNKRIKRTKKPPQ